MSDITLKDQTAAAASIIAAAAALAGPAKAGQRDRIRNEAIELTTMMMDGLGAYIGDLLNGRTFTGTIVSLDFEESSKRPLVIIKPDTVNFNGKFLTDKKNQTETVRADRIDKKPGAVLHEKLQALVGKRCKFYVAMEPMKGTDEAAKAIRHVVDISSWPTTTTQETSS